MLRKGRTWIAIRNRQNYVNPNRSWFTILLRTTSNKIMTYCRYRNVNFPASKRKNVIRIILDFFTDFTRDGLLRFFYLTSYHCKECMLYITNFYGCAKRKLTFNLRFLWIDRNLTRLTKPYLYSTYRSWTHSKKVHIWDKESVQNRQKKFHTPALCRDKFLFGC